MGMEITTSTSMGAVAYKHDKRLTISKNVNHELISDNITLIDKIEEYQKEWKPKTWTDAKGKEHTEPRPTSIGGWMRRIIDERMQPYMDQWNDKKRKDRQTNKTYTEWHDDQRKNSANKKGDLFYEFSMQMGSKDDLGGLYYELQRQLAADPENEELKEQYNDLRTQFVETYKKWLDDMQEKYGLTVLYAFIHFDEGFRETPEGEVCGTPHMHVCVCPITDPSRSEFRKGPAVQVSMNKVMEAAGVERMALRSDISDIQQEMEQVVGQEFKDKESYKHAYQLGRFFIGYRETQEQDARNLGYEIKAPSQEKRKHERPEQYIINKELAKQGQRLMEQNQELKEENQDLEEQRNQVNQEIVEKKAAAVEAEKRRDAAEKKAVLSEVKHERLQEENTSLEAKNAILTSTNEQNKKQYESTSKGIKTLVETFSQNVKPLVEFMEEDHKYDEYILEELPRETKMVGFGKNRHEVEVRPECVLVEKEILKALVQKSHSPVAANRMKTASIQIGQQLTELTEIADVQSARESEEKKVQDHVKDMENELSQLRHNDKLLSVCLDWIQELTGKELFDIRSESELRNVYKDAVAVILDPECEFPVDEVIQIYKQHGYTDVVKKLEENSAELRKQYNHNKEQLSPLDQRQIMERSKSRQKIRHDQMRLGHQPETEFGRVDWKIQRMVDELQKIHEQNLRFTTQTQEHTQNQSFR